MGNWTETTEPRRGGTSLNGKEHPSCSQTTENLEGQTEKIDSLGLRFPKKYRCGSARKRARKARLAESPDGATDGGQPQTPSGIQQQILRSTSASVARGGSLCGTKTPEGGERPHGSQKRQRSAGSLRAAGILRGPSRLDSLVMPEPLRRASGWPLYAKAILEIISQGITS